LQRLIFLYFEACFEAWYGVSFVKKLTQPQKRMCTMKNKLSLLAFSAQKINRQHIQLFFLIISLAMLVIGIGAPADGGGAR